MNGLMLHCGASQATWDDVCSVVVEDSLTSDTYTPVPHATLVNQVLEVLDDFNLWVVEEAHALMKRKQRYFGYFKIRNRNHNCGVPTDSDGNNIYDFTLGIRNGHDGQVPASAVFGQSCFVCDNMAFYGDMMQFTRRHTRNVLRDLPRVIYDNFAELHDYMDGVNERYGVYNDNAVKDSSAFNDILITALRYQAVTATHIPHVIREWDRSISGEGPGGHPELSGNSYWSLLNCFTEVAKNRPSPAVQPARTSRLTKLLDQYVGLTPQLTSGGNFS